MNTRAGADGPSLCRNRAFVIVWTGGIVSELSSSMSSLLFPLAGFALTRSCGGGGNHRETITHRVRNAATYSPYLGEPERTVRSPALR